LILAGPPTTHDVFAKRPAGSSIPSVLFTPRIIVGVGDLAISKNYDVPLGTDALSSSVGSITVDPVSRTASLKHPILTDSKITPEKAISLSAIFS
jgi:hypothetical protein